MADAGITEKLSLLHPYITVHNGVDSVVELQNSTKQLPVDRWEKLIEGVKNLGIHVVQIGTSNETRLPGVDWDLRGETTFSELCFILKDALLHIDTEGGLVHMARAANKKSIVLFGPTSPDFFAYPQNINLVATECSNCWWVTNDWLRECPLGKETTCMDTIDISAIPDIVKNELKLSRARSFQLVTKSLFSKKFVEDEADLVDSIHTAAGLVDEGLGTHAADMTSGPYVHASKKWEYPFAVKCLENHFGSLKGLKVADIGSGRGALVFGLAQKGAEASVFDIDYQWDNQGDPGIEDRFLALGNRFANISFGSIFNIPANSGEYDAVICISVIEHIIHKRVAIQELLRLLKVGGMLVLTFDLVDARQNHQHLFDGIRKEIFEAASLDHHIGALCGEAHLFTPEEIAENARHIHDAGVLGIPEGMTVGGIALIRTQ